MSGRNARFMEVVGTRGGPKMGSFEADYINVGDRWACGAPLILYDGAMVSGVFAVDPLKAYLSVNSPFPSPFVAAFPFASP